MKLGPRQCSRVDGELFAQRQVLEGDLAMAAEEEGQEPKQVEQEVDHRAHGGRIRGDRSTTWLPNRVLAKDRYPREHFLVPVPSGAVSR
jgi:hypothetical protein